MNKNSNNISQNYSPIAIGCIGGSGSRIVSQILINQGYYFGDCLNRANDNLWYSFLFRRLSVVKMSNREISELIHVFVTKMEQGKLSDNQITIIKNIEKNQHTLPKFLVNRSVESLLNDTKTNPDNENKRQLKWGWKEPNSHLLLTELNKQLPQLKYIFIVRHALDMAFSKNQQQLILWGKHYLGSDCVVSPYYSLKLWLLMYLKIKKQKIIMGNKLYILDYDKLVESPFESVRNLCQFVKSDISDESISTLSKLVKTQNSSGRYKGYDLDVFDEKDLEFLYSKKILV